VIRVVRPEYDRSATFESHRTSSTVDERIEDATALLAASRWSGAYYLTGYALECALKSCVLAYNDYVSIAAAFWISPADSEDRFLYIASAEINDEIIRTAYGEVLRRIGSNRNQWLDAFQIKLLNSSDPLAAEVVEIRNRYPLTIPTRYNGSSIAGLAIDGAYIYPPITAARSAP